MNATCGKLHTIPMGWTLACSMDHDHSGACQAYFGDRLYEW